MKKIISIILCLCIISALTACGGSKPLPASSSSGSTSSALPAEPTAKTETEIKNEYISAQNNFGANLLKQCYIKNENAIISPVSVSMALGMLLCGAGGDTAAEIEKVIGNNLTAAEINRFAAEYIKSITAAKSLSIANSVWIRNTDKLAVKQSFVDSSKAFYNAEIYKEPFDNKTLSDINSWVKKNTDGMIKKILDKISPDDMLFLINALVFEEEWESKYTKGEVTSGIFNAASGEKQKAQMLISTEYNYIHSANAEGFIKNYKGGRFGYAAVLPNKNIGLDNYIKGLSGEEITSLINSSEHKTVFASMPKFTAEYEITLNDALKNLGINKAFLPDADFTPMATAPDNLFVSEVVHKTYIDVNETGTKAAAVTEIGMKNACAPDGVTITVDRPFIFMILDLENGLPVFIGAVNSIS